MCPPFVSPGNGFAANVDMKVVVRPESRCQQPVSHQMAPKRSSMWFSHEAGIRHRFGVNA